MTDRELLELAAKAAGIEAWPGVGFQSHMLFTRSAKSGYDGRVTGVEWNPLTDDGDALRLAVACGISFGISADTGRMRVAWFIGGELHTLDMPENHPMELPASAIEWLRRAIVRAAAAIGEAMP